MNLLTPLATTIMGLFFTVPLLFISQYFTDIKLRF